MAADSSADAIPLFCNIHFTPNQSYQFKQNYQESKIYDAKKCVINQALIDIRGAEFFIVPERFDFGIVYKKQYSSRSVEQISTPPNQKAPLHM